MTNIQQLQRAAITPSHVRYSHVSGCPGIDAMTENCARKRKHLSMRPVRARRAHQPSVDVQEPGEGKALLHVLADGRSTGRYKLSKRQLDEVSTVPVLLISRQMYGYVKYTVRWRIF